MRQDIAVPRHIAVAEGEVPVTVFSSEWLTPAGPPQVPGLCFDRCDQQLTR